MIEYLAFFCLGTLAFMAVLKMTIKDAIREAYEEMDEEAADEKIGGTE